MLDKNVVVCYGCFMPKLNKLSYRQEKFIEYYLGEASGNATQAARLAGYKHPGNRGQMLKKLLKTTIKDKQEEEAKQPGSVLFTRRERQEWLANFARNDEISNKLRLEALKEINKTNGDHIQQVRISYDEMEVQDLETEAVSYMLQSEEMRGLVITELQKLGYCVERH